MSPQDDAPISPELLRLRIASEISEAVARAGFDHEGLLATIAEHIAARVGDSCAIHLLSDDRRHLRAVGFHHREPDLHEVLAPQYHTSRVAPTEGIIGEVLRTGRSRLIRDMEPVDRSALDTMEMDKLHQLEAGSAIFAPMIVADEVIGTLHLARGCLAEPYSEDELRLVEDVAGRCAQAILNAHLFQAMQFELDRRQDAEEQLEQIELTWHSVLENIPGYVFITDEDGVVQLASREPPACGSLIGRPLTEFAARSHRAGLAHALGRVLRSGTRSEVDLVGHGGNRWFRMVVGPLHSAEEEEGLAILATDITEEKATALALAEKLGELSRSNAELEQFAYVVSHDLTAPLRALSGFSQLLERQLGEDALDARSANYLGQIQTAAQRLDGMMNGLLTYSRINTRDRPRPVSLQEVFERIRREFATRLEDGDVHLSCDPLPTVAIDPWQAAQLFRQLLDNALRHTGSAERTRVHFSAQDNGESHLFTCVDNGRGIETDDAERIFGMFVAQGPTAGVGCGLPIARRIVERRGGRIWVESSPGHGSAFYFTLPVDSATEDPA